jgi:hypothetical protein
MSVQRECVCLLNHTHVLRLLWHTNIRSTTHTIVHVNNRCCANMGDVLSVKDMYSDALHNVKVSEGVSVPSYISMRAREYTSVGDALRDIQGGRDCLAV